MKKYKICMENLATAPIANGGDIPCGFDEISCDSLEEVKRIVEANKTIWDIIEVSIPNEGSQTIIEYRDGEKIK